MTPTLHISSRKYEPLTEFLRRQPRDVVRMSFEEIERVIRVKLPASALDHRAWWSNNSQNNVMTKAWRDAGFQSEDVDMKGRRVTFRRVPSDPPPDVAAPARDQATGDHHPLLGWMKGTLAVAKGVDLTLPADPEWGHAASGGSTQVNRK